MAIRETVAVDPEIAKSFANNPLTASVNTNLNVNESKPVVAICIAQGQWTPSEVGEAYIDEYRLVADVERALELDLHL
jgi:hypothetical protein